MSLLSVAKFKQISDSIAKQHDLLKESVGDAQTAGTVQYGIEQNLQRVMGLNDFDPMSALLQSTGQAKTSAHPLNLSQACQSEIIASLNTHLGGLDNWLSGSDVRVHPYFEEVAEHCGQNISPANVFPPAINTSIGLGRINKDTPDTYTDGAAINTNLYGKANLYAQITSVASGSVSWTVSISCKKLNEEIEGQQVAFSLAALNQTSDIGLADTDMYIDIISIATVGGGSTGDAISIYSKEERTIVL